MYKLFLILSFLITSFCAFSQGLTEKYTSFDLGIVRGNLEFEGSDFNLNFTENSIRELEFIFEKELPSTQDYTALDVAFKWGKYKGISYSAFANFVLTGQGKNKAGLSVGYNYPIEIGIFDLLVRPSLGFSGLSALYSVGSAQIDTIGVVIEDTDYIDRELNISIGHSTCFLSPKFEMAFLIEQKFAITASASYDYAINIGEQDFSYTAMDFDATAVAFDSEFHNFTVDGVTPTENIFTTNGLIYTFGVSWYYNRE